MLCVILNSCTIDCDKTQCFESYKIISIGITLLCCTITTIVREKLSKKKMEPTITELCTQNTKKENLL